MENPTHRSERFYLKLLAAGFIGLFLLIALIWGGNGLYVKWQEKRLVSRAIRDMEKGDDRAASLEARSALDLKANSASAMRVMAQLGERTGDRIALDWRRKIVGLKPDSIDDAVGLARTALQFSDLTTAEQALARVNQKGPQMASYHATVAMLANARQQPEKAESELMEALRLAPNEKDYQLQLAILHLSSPKEDQHAAGQAMLEKLCADPKYRVPATRALIAGGVARRESDPRLLELARQLQEYPEATLSDRLIYLDFLHQLHDPQFASKLTELEKNSAETPAALSEVLAWMSRSNLNLLAIDFLKTVSPNALQKWPVPLAVADIYVRLNDWKELEKATKDANWTQLDFLRHAYLARAYRGEDKPAAAEHEWGAAIKGASAQPDLVGDLVRLTSDWGWQNETVELLWALSKFPEKQNEALRALYLHYSKSNNTEGIHRVLVRLFELDPSNLNVENNLAQVSLLLNANPAEAQRLAAEVYHKMPSNPAYATTYAYSLLRKGDLKGALRTLGSFSAEQLKDPSIGAYYGICLAAAGDQKAKPYLEAGQRAALLPEEKTLIDKAIADLDWASKHP